MADALTVREVAERLGVSRTTVWTMLRNGELCASQNPIDKREHLIPLAAVESLLRGGRVPARRRQRPQSIGIIADGSVPSDRYEEWMRQRLQES